MANKSWGRLQRLLNRIQRKVPLAAGFIGWVRKPSSTLIRLPLALALIAGGVFSFLPVLGLWMLPLGLLLLAIDLTPLRGPVSAAALRIERRWMTWQRKRKARARAATSGRG